ncbi:MAG: DNA-binding protein [Gammaproteobacteria bacterium]|nr:DNA-binding protein [Gammaproteobacteria bacterium]
MNEPTQKPKRLQNTREVAERLGVAHRVVAVWRSRGYGPPWMKIGRAIRYDPESLEQWLKTTTSSSN